MVSFCAAAVGDAKVSCAGLAVAAFTLSRVVRDALAATLDAGIDDGVPPAQAARSPAATTGATHVKIRRIQNSKEGKEQPPIPMPVIGLTGMSALRRNGAHYRIVTLLTSYFCYDVF